MTGFDDGSIKDVEFQPGEFLFHENEKSYHFFIIQEGQVEVFKTGKDDTEISLAIVESGTSIGEFAMIDRQPRSASARAISIVRAALITEDAYKQLLEELPDWAIAVMQGLVERIRHMNELIHQHNVTDETLTHKINSAEFDPECTVVNFEAIGKKR